MSYQPAEQREGQGDLAGAAKRPDPPEGRGQVGQRACRSRVVPRLTRAQRALRLTRPRRSLRLIRSASSRCAPMCAVFSQLLIPRRWRSTARMEA